MAIEVNILTQPTIKASIKTFVSTSEDYQNGYSDGYDKGKNDGEKQGVQAEYDRFWDALQQNGNRDDWYCAFRSWDRHSFKPKYDIKPKVAYMLFWDFGKNDSVAIDLVEYLESLGVTLDFSACNASNSLQYAFNNANFSHIGIIDSTSCPTFYSTFASCKAHTIDKLILKSDGSQIFSGVFNGANNLINLTIEGTIGQNDFSLLNSNLLSKASITSIINALSSTTSGLTVTISKTAKTNAFTDSEWATLIATKSNWTINLV